MVCLIILCELQHFCRLLVAKSGAFRGRAGNTKGGASGSGTKGSGGHASQTCALLRKGQPVPVQKVKLPSLETCGLDVANLRAI